MIRYIDVLGKNKQVRGGLWFSVAEESCGLCISFWSDLLCVCAQLLQCLTLWDPVDCSQPGSSRHGILLARILEGVAISYSRGLSWLKDWTCVSYISCIGRQALYEQCHLGSPSYFIQTFRCKIQMKPQTLPWVTMDTRASQECSLCEQTSRCYGINFFPCYWGKKNE